MFGAGDNEPQTRALLTSFALIGAHRQMDLPHPKVVRASRLMNTQVHACTQVKAFWGGGAGSQARPSPEG